MRYRLRTLLFAMLLVAVVVTGYVILQLEAIRVAKESAEFERARDAAAKSAVHSRQRDPFVTAKGELHYVGSKELRREVGYANESLVIRTIVPDWSHVEEGDLIVEFDSSELEKQRTAQAVVVETLRSLLGQAEQRSDESVAHQARFDIAESKLKDLEDEEGSFRGAPRFSTKLADPPVNAPR